MYSVIDTKMAKFTHIKYIITTISISVNHAIKPYLLSNNRKLCCRLSIGSGMNLAITFKKPEYSHFAGRTTLTFACATEVTFIYFN